MSSFFLSLSDAGERIARRGWNVNGSSEDFISQISATHRLESLLAGVISAVDRLRDATLRARLDSARMAAAEPKQTKASADATADGLLYCYSLTATGKADRRTKDCDVTGLSVRARKTLLRMGDVMLSELTAERLDDVRNCGEITTDELLAWARSLMTTQEAAQ